MPDVDDVTYSSEGPQVGWIALANGEFVPPEEYERRQAALTPEQRALQERIAGGFARIADEMRVAHEAIKD